MSSRGMIRDRGERKTAHSDAGLTPAPVPAVLPPQFAPLANYDAARAALDRAVTIDQIRSYRDKTVGLLAYAKQARDREIEHLAREMRERAGRRAGETIEQLRKSGQLLANGGDRKSVSRSSTLIYDEGAGKSDGPRRLIDLGLTRDEASRFVKLAKIPSEVFELRMAAIRDPAPGAKMAVHTSSASTEWLTPIFVTEKVQELFGTIDLDPCSNAKGEKANIPAVRHFIKADDGLNKKWEGRVYMNPPYGNEVGHWIDKLLAEHRAARVAEAIVLVAARTDTSWWRVIPAAAPICLIAGRLTFSGSQASPNPAPFPSAIFYLGPRAERFVSIFDALGPIYGQIQPWRKDRNP